MEELMEINVTEQEAKILLAAMQTVQVSGTVREVRQILQSVESIEQKLARVIKSAAGSSGENVRREEIPF